jgi:putative transposase
VQPGWVVQAYRFVLDPNASQLPLLHSRAGAARAAYNWAVARVGGNWEQRAAGESYGLTGDGLTPWQGWTLPALRKSFSAVKVHDPRFAGWWDRNPEGACSTGLANATAALKNWHESRTGSRGGARVGFPRFKKRAKARLSCRFTTGAVRVEADRRHVTLPRLGTIRTHESTRKPRRRLAGGRARVLSAAVGRECGGRWFVSLQVEVRRGRGQVTRPGTAVGVDLGIRHLAVLADSTGEVHFEPNPKHLRRAQAALRRANRTPARRQGPVVFDPGTGKKSYRAPSANWPGAKAALGKAHARVRHLREDSLHQLTTRVAGMYGTVVVEDLNVAGMLKNGGLALRRRVRGSPSAAVRCAASPCARWA